jgi:hypothetical protein
MRLIAADAQPVQASAGDYAELAVATGVYYCMTCGPILREHCPNGDRITWHLALPHPYTAQLHDEELVPIQ